MPAAGQDEWYSFRTDPRAPVQVLMTLDEASYGVGGLAMGDHPIAWYHEFESGRAWYTALGHPREAYDNELFTRHLLGGLRWAAGELPERSALAAISLRPAGHERSAWSHDGSGTLLALIADNVFCVGSV